MLSLLKFGLSEYAGEGRGDVHGKVCWLIAYRCLLYKTLCREFSMARYIHKIHIPQTVKQ